MNKKVWMIVGGAVLALTLIVGIGAVAVHAQSPTSAAPGDRPGFGNRPHGPHFSQAELDAAAQALGMTSSDLSTELQSGKTLSDIAKEKGVDLQTVMDAIKVVRDSEMRAQINQAVADGKMTQDKANWLLEGLDKGYLDGPGFGFGFGFGPHDPNGQGQPPQPTP